MTKFVGPSQVASSFKDATGSNYQCMTTDSVAQTYRAAILYTLSVATPTAIIVMQGSASRTIRIRRIHLAGWSTTAGTMKFKLSRRSSNGVLGSAVLTTIPSQGPNDLRSVPSTLSISTVSGANYGTLGTLSAILDTGLVNFSIAAGVSANASIDFVGLGQAFVMRGINDYLTIDGGADAGGDAVPTGGVLCASVEWVEDNS